MNNKTDQTVQAYLNSIDFGPLLTRKEEETLIKSIEVHQKEIISQLVAYPYSRMELRSYLQSLDSSGESIIDISKKLDDESSKDLVSQIETKFKALIKELQKDDVPSLLALLEEVSLTGTIIHGVTSEIKKKHASIYEAESKVKQVMKYFTQESDSTDVMFKEVDEHGDELKTRLAGWGFSGVKIDNKIHEFRRLISEYMIVKKGMPDGVSFEDVKTIYKLIGTSEMQALKFKNELITRNLRLVVSRAKTLIGKGLDFADLIQEGNIGLMKAVDKFDSSKKTKVSTYATWWIDQSIRRAISNKGKTVRVPTHIEWMQTNLNKLIQKMTGTLKRPPTLKELADESGIELKVLEDLHTRAQHEIGLEEELSSGMTLLDTLPADPMENPFTIVEQRLLKERIRDILATLPPRTEKIIRLRFGLGEVPDDEGMTLQEIANQIGITKQGVRVVECSAFKVLKKRAKGMVNE